MARTVNPTGEQLAGEVLGDDADALVSVTPYKTVTLTGQMGGSHLMTHPTGREDQTRTAQSVRVADLLPPGTRIARAPTEVRLLPLELDGRKINATVATVDAGNELADGRYDLVSGGCRPARTRLRSARRWPTRRVCCPVATFARARSSPPVAASGSPWSGSRRC